MKTLAAVTTSKGIGAISSIQITGQGAEAIINKIFKSGGVREPNFAVGNILVGNIIDGQQIIDHVVVACEGESNFAINCHGNPIIVEMIMKLLKDNGAELTTAEKFLANEFAKNEGLNAIEIESKLTRLKAVTLEGVKIVANQTRMGLGKVAAEWLERTDTISLEDIRNKCKEILARSQTAELIINGCTVVIAGPPNSGKSTLLNFLCGRQKAIVADIAGTTRDWVGAKCKIESLEMELIDTAGLDEDLTVKNDIEKESQKRALELVNNCDLVLLVLDGSQAACNWRGEFQKGKKVLAVFNKMDLGKDLHQKYLDVDFAASVRISAKAGDGIDELIEKIREVLGVKGFDLAKPVCFTQRQKRLLESLMKAETAQQAKSLITELLNSEVCV